MFNLPSYYFINPKINKIDKEKEIENGNDSFNYRGIEYDVEELNNEVIG